jgi:hypothetical protein
MIPTLALVATLIATPTTQAPSQALRFTLPANVSFLATDAPSGGASDQEAHGSIVSRVAIAAFMIGQFADITTTEYGIGAGKIREANPLFRRAVEQGPVVAGLAKGTFAVLVSWIMLRAQIHHAKATFFTAFLLTGVQAYVTWHNAQLLR